MSTVGVAVNRAVKKRIDSALALLLAEVAEDARALPRPRRQLLAATSGPASTTRPPTRPR